MSARILVTGATGLLGRALVRALAQRGDEVLALSRRPDAAQRLLPSGVRIVAGDPTAPGAWQGEVAGVDAVVHLAGESVFDRRWSEAQKRRLWDSRIDATKLVAAAVAASPRARTLVSASAIGFYGARGDERLGENEPAGDDFLARLCVAWEAAAAPAAAAGKRLAMPRVGVVLAKDGGALATMARPFRLGLGAIVGTGRQWVSWIHAEDMTAVLLRALDDASLAGPLNATAPEPVTNADLSRAVAAALRRPLLLKAPRAALRVVMGEVADIMATGQRVVPGRLLEAGFRFRHTEAAPAVAALLT